MKKITKKELDSILKKHELWLNDEEGGKKADLSNVSLSHMELRGVNLRGADLSGANLKDTNLSSADLSGANLIAANLFGSFLHDANLSYADISSANLTSAFLGHANLKDVIFDEATSSFALHCPEEGSFIGYKTVKNKLIKLLITEDAKRSSATTTMCRCSKAKVLKITDIEEGKEFDSAKSCYDEDFIYKVGKIVEVEDFDEDRWLEASKGIHFFITKEEALQHNKNYIEYIY